MIYSENAINVMATRIYKGIGRAWIVKNLSTPKSEEEILQLLNFSLKSDEKTNIDEFDKKKSALRRVLSASAGAIDGVIAIGDDDFPQYRGSVKNSERPIFLFYRGDISLLSIDSKNIAVIGLLNPSRDIEVIERKLVSALVASGAVIVSGLALGCDSIAHQQAIASKGKTIAILPGPLNDIMPAKNKNLAEDIVSNGGLLISEYLTASKSKMELNGRYQERDRLQALFSNAIVLSASYAKNDVGNDSGSRLAMGYARDYSIPRVVIYDHERHANNPMFDLNRQIIQEEPGVVVYNDACSALEISRILRSNPIIPRQSPIQQSMI